MEAGWPAWRVARELNTNHPAVGKIKKRFNKIVDLGNLPRSGRPPKLTRAKRWYILWLIRNNRLLLRDEFVYSTDGIVYRDTIKRVIQFYYKRK